MPALNFMKQFANDVELGVKRQSIRPYRKDGRPHCKAGARLKLYTGQRTKSCRLLGVATVLSVRDVEIHSTEMFINGTRLFQTIYDRDAPQTDNEFAEADGFESFTEMANWFDEKYGLPFKGVVIEWGEPS
jgi:hypothetical protein